MSENESILLGVGDAERNLLQIRETESELTERLSKQFPGLNDTFRRTLVEHYPLYEYFKDDYELWTEFPFRAAVIKPGEVEIDGRVYSTIDLIASSGNEVNSEQNSLNHAEKVAIEKAMHELGSKHLDPDSILISNIEPCAMCASAFHHAGGKTLIYGAYQSDIRGDSTVVNHSRKSFRTEPEGYSVDRFLRERDPGINVTGGYMRSNVLRKLSRFDETQEYSLRDK